MALIKIHMHLNNESFSYRATEYLDVLESKGFIITKRDSNNKLLAFSLTPAANKLLKNSFILNDRLFDKIDTTTSIDVVSKLADEMRSIFPKGKKDNKWYFRSTKPTVIEKLQKFSVKYKIQLSTEYDNIIEATKQYVSNFEGSQGGMSIIKYFIEKQNNGSILLEYLEQLGEDNEDPDTPSNTTKYI